MSNNKKTSKKKLKKNRDEKIRISIGLFFIVFSIITLLSFTSYLFTWKADQSIITLPLGEIMHFKARIILNWGGKLGVVLSSLFIYKWFGMASYGFIVISTLIGIQLLTNKKMLFNKVIADIFIEIIILSVLLGFIFGDSYFLIGGGHGYFICQWMTSLIGRAGTLLSIIIVALIFIVYRFNDFYKRSVEYFKNIKLPKSQRTDNNSETAEEYVTEENDFNNQFSNNEQIEEVVEQSVQTNIVDKSDENQIDFEIEAPQIDSIVDEDEVINNEQVTEGDLSLSISEQDLNSNLVDVNVTYNDNKQTLEGDSSEEPKEQTEEKLGLEVKRFEEEISNKENNLDKIEGDFDPRLDLENYKPPTLSLLPKLDTKGKQNVSSEELNNNKNKIVETLANYKIKIDKIKATIGPTVTLYEIIPAPGVRISKIKNLEDDIALSLAALGIRIIAPMPGKGTIGIEVPNSNPEIVTMRSVLASKKFQESEMALPIALGKTITNETYVIDLAKMPHLLIAGATGQGKSVGLNVILASLLYKKHPAELKLVLIDPKKVELSLFNNIKNHFLAQIPDAEEPIITDTQKVINTLNSLTIEMDQRYELLKIAHTKNIKEYNAKFIQRKLNPLKGHKFLPYIVVVIDEFADLIMTAGKEIELPLARLAQLARAIGIHLVIATQRPTTNIITGVIKANFPARMAFRVTSGIDSKTILDSSGANQLIGRGDMLLSVGTEPIRLQCAFIDTPELERIVDHIGNQQGYTHPLELPEFNDEKSTEPGAVDLSNRDALFDDAARIIVIHQQGSTSLIQRKFSIGYNRAGRIIDQLEAAGVVGQFEGSKARQVLIPDEYALEQLLNTLNK